MSVSPKPSAREFRFGLGHPVLEFVATLAGRRREPEEQIADPSDLSRWLREADLVADARCDEALLEAAQALREAIYRIVDCARNRKRPRSADVDLLNQWASEPSPLPHLTSELRQTWIAADPGRAALARIATMAIELITGPDLAHIRNCADPTCSLLFIDRSRPGQRRWCSMERCGNREKTARYRRRRRSTRSRS